MRYAKERAPFIWLRFFVSHQYVKRQQLMLRESGARSNRGGGGGAVVEGISELS